ncbi:MAG: polyhydroxybutyrate depolymerase [Sphingomonadales bacterium]|nr:polyhydroxybutyrate depolymerase [Sphingomonadales bacterium]
MRIAARIALWAGGTAVLLLALAFYLLYAPPPAEPELSARPIAGTIEVGALRRQYLVFAPAHRGTAPALLVVFHGRMGSPASIRAETGYGFDRLAERDGFVVAYPQGVEGRWTSCRKSDNDPARRGVDDLAFFDALVERLRRDLGVDPARVFVAGVSNGGQFVYRLALERPRAIAGAAVFAAALPTRDDNLCGRRGGPPPMMIVDGTDDPISPYLGGMVSLFGFSDLGTVLSANDTARYFAGPGPAPATARLAPRARGDRTWVERADWRRPGRNVVLLSVHGGGHVVPQAAYRPPRLLGGVTSAIDGPAEAWEFFRRR